MKTSKLITVAVLAASALGFGNSAQAAPTRNDCPIEFTTTDPNVQGTGGVTAASDCEYLTPPDADFTATITNINIAGFFGFTDWEENTAKFDLPEGDGLSGAWEITNPDFASFDYIIVFKDGGKTNLVAFLFNELFEDGVWTTPFEDPPFDFQQPNPTDVSHFIIAQRPTGEPPCEVDCGPLEIPEPNGLALMSLGLLGATFAVRRRRLQRRA